ncbi:MAG TPA: ATP-binding protein [Myxococcota bacterium]|nr:ATP-binding protein [Myxococcota bacterium]
MRPRPQRLLDYHEYPILYVDDERENLRVFELAFKRDFAVVTAESGEQGLRLLHERPIAIVLSDHRMPGMTGVQFLSQVREVDAKTIRMLVTAYGDAETLGGAINDGSIYRYLAKPWRPDEMRLALKRGIEVYALDREREDLLRELTILNRVSQSITQQLDLHRLLDLLLKTVTRELGFDCASLLFFEAKFERLVEEKMDAGGRARPAEVPPLAIRRSEAPRFFARLRAGESQMLRIDSAQDLEPPIRRWVLDVAADQILVLPLIGKQEVIGALVVDNRRGGGPLGVPEHTLLEGFSNQAVIALENARLVEELRQSRAEVLRADRLGRLGTLAAGLAHEINNPLVAIRTFLSLAPAKRAEDDPEFWDGYHALACREVDRIGTLVSTMVHLARGQGNDAPREACDLGELVREGALLLQREADRAEVMLAVECAHDTPKLFAVRDQLHQVLLNLVMNAIHATPPGGRVAVSTAAGEGKEGGEAVLEVSDTGCGIPPEDLERIFDPFFTTKDPDRGTGLGLMICHRIVADHGGTIEVTSREGEGSRFRVRLPAGG